MKTSSPIWREQTCLLHHDNAPSHTAVLTHQFLAKNKIPVIPLPPYSPDLAPCDFSIFPKMKLKLKGRRFDTVEAIQAKTQKMLDPLTEKDFQEAFQNGGEGGTDVYMREGTTSRMTAADRPYGKFYDFCSVSPENFGSTLVEFIIPSGTPASPLMCWVIYSSQYFPFKCAYHLL